MKFSAFCQQSWLGSHRFISSEELMEGAKTWLSSQAADFFDTGIQELIPQRGKYLTSSGEYIEKWLKYVRIFRIKHFLSHCLFC
jgi:hypothetical protein